MFERCSLTFRPVEAQSGEIGGDVNHEFMAVAAVGEDDFVWCTACDYAANVEAARRGHTWKHDSVPKVEAPEMAKHHTPNMPGIAPVAAFFEVDASRTLKCIAFDIDGELGLALVPGDREVNEHALRAAVAPKPMRLLDDEDFDARKGLPKGYIGPHFAGVSAIVADPSVAEPIGWITGANEADHHVRDAVLGRDFSVDVWADLVTIVSGDACPNCGQALSVDRGIEVGHVFQLGTKYAEALDVQYTDANGEQHPMVMGCYGIGISRIVAAVVEEFHDENGMMWPVALAPYDVHLIALAGRGDQAEKVIAEADRLYEALTDRGMEVLYDDREASPGVKFADADLLGMPVQLVVGAKGLARGIVERKVRATGERDEVSLGDV